MSGSDGCNNYFGEYVLDGAKLTFKQPMGSTMMACEEPVMAQASSFMQALQATAILQHQRRYADAEERGRPGAAGVHRRLPGAGRHELGCDLGE